jgi:hypothetical protein
MIPLFCSLIDSTPETVFVTMPTFASPAYFLDMLASRYAVPPEYEVGADVHRDTYVPIQLRVIKLIKYWVDQFYFEYFASDPKLHDALIRFLSDRCTQDYVKTHVDALLRNVADAGATPQFREPAQVLTFANSKSSLGASDADPHHVSLAEFGAVDVARQLAQRMHAVSRVVEWHSLNKHALEAIARLFGVLGEQDPLNLVGSAPTLTTSNAVSSPNVVALAQAYWDLRQFLEDEVLVCVHAAADGVTKSGAVAARQAALIELFCDVAIELFSMRSYLGAFAVVAVLLGKLSKKVIKGAWKTVSKKKEARLAEIAALASPKKHFKDLRAATAADEQHPNTPWPPAIADWLLETMASAPDFLPSGLGDLIDMDKRARVAAQLRRIRATQHTTYPFQKSPFLAAYFALTPSARRHVESAAEARSDSGDPSDTTAAAAAGADDDDDGDEQSHTSDDDSAAAAPAAATRQRRTSTISEGGGSPSLAARSSMSQSSPSKRGLGGLVRSLTRSQRSPAKKSDDAPSSPTLPSSASPSPTTPTSPSSNSDSGGGGQLTRTRSSSMGKSTRKAAHPAGVSTLRTTSRSEDDRGGNSVDDDDGSDSDSGGAHDEATDAMNSPRLQSARRLLRARTAADEAAAASEQSSFVSSLAASGNADDAATLRSLLLNAIKRSPAARHMMLERLNAASGGQLQSQVALFDAHDDEQLQSSERVREAFDAAIAQSTHFNAYIDTNNRGSDSASSSPRSDRASSPAPANASYFSFPAETAATRLASGERAGRLRSTSVESHSSQESSPRTHAPLDRAKLASSLGPSFSLLSHSSASAASSASPRLSLALSRRVSSLHIAPELDATLVVALSHIYPARHLRAVSLDDKLGRVYGWPTTVQLHVLDDDKGDEPPLFSLPTSTRAAKRGNVPLTINAFRATADGVAADDCMAGCALPFRVGTAVDAAELALFVRAAQLYRSGSQISKASQLSNVIGVLAVRLIDDALQQRATSLGVRVIVF